MQHQTPSTTSFRRRWITSLGAIVWVVVAFIGVQLLLVVTVQLLQVAGIPIAGMNQTVAMFLLAAVSYAAALAVTVYVPHRLKRLKTSLADVGLSRLASWSDLLTGPLAFIPYFLLSGTLLHVATLLIPGFDINQQQEVGFENLTNRVEVVLAFLALVVIAPVAEELLFRGYLYTNIKRRLGMIAAIVLVSATFAVLHGQLNVGIDTFALSIVLCGLRELSGSVWAGIVLHMTKNLVAFYFLFINPITGMM